MDINTKIPPVPQNYIYKEYLFNEWHKYEAVGNIWRLIIWGNLMALIPLGLGIVLI